jgi:hypothetical protein
MTEDQLHALLNTLVLETVLAIWLTRRWPAERRPASGQVLLFALSASLITHPLLYGLIRWRPELLSLPLRYAIWESAVVVVETAVYMRGLRCGFRRALGLSVACNALSLFLPMAVRAWW